MALPWPPVAAHIEDDDDDGDEGGVHPAMKGAVYAIMAGAIIWTAVMRNGPWARQAETAEMIMTREERLMKIGSTVFTAIVLVLSVLVLLAMAVVNCVNASRLVSWRSNEIYSEQEDEEQEPFILV